MTAPFDHKAAEGRNKREPLDDIRAFLGNIHDNEYAARAVIRKGRDFASFRVRQVESSDARQFYWIAVETAQRWIYAPASIRTLQDVGKFLSRCAVLAEQAENLDADHGL